MYIRRVFYSGAVSFYVALKDARSEDSETVTIDRAVFDALVEELRKFSDMKMRE